MKQLLLNLITDINDMNLITHRHERANLTVFFQQVKEPPPRGRQ